MKIQSIVLSVLLGFSALSVLAETEQSKEASKHNQAAIEHGKMGHAPILVEHAEAALKAAEASQKTEPNPHIGEATNHVKMSIEHGKMGHADIATTHAEEAQKHFDMAGKGAK